MHSPPSLRNVIIWTLWEKARVGCFKRTASKHGYYLGWNRSPAQVGCMRQVLGPGALGRPRGIGWRGRWEGGSGWGTHVNPWLFHFNVWQNSLQIKQKTKQQKKNWCMFFKALQHIFPPNLRRCHQSFCRRSHQLENVFSLYINDRDFEQSFSGRIDERVGKYL